jgi:hypothetical protein
MNIIDSTIPICGDEGKTKLNFLFKKVMIEFTKNKNNKIDCPTKKVNDIFGTTIILNLIAFNAIFFRALLFLII